MLTSFELRGVAIGLVLLFVPRLAILTGRGTYTDRASVCRVKEKRAVVLDLGRAGPVTRPNKGDVKHADDMPTLNTQKEENRVTAQIQISLYTCNPCVHVARCNS